MQYIELGQTNMNVSRVGFGAIPIRRLSFSEAEKVIKTSIDKGINFFDTARNYGDSEEKLGKVLSDGYRDNMFLATKSVQRTAEGLMEELHTSLDKLKTDYIDLYQIHNVRKEEDFETVMGPDGALEAMKKAKEQGKIRHIAVTSHDIEISKRAIQTREFVSIMVPFNFMENSFGDEVIPMAMDADMGVIIMKPFAGGMLEDANAALRYVLSYSDEVVAIPGMGAVDEVRENTELGAIADPLTDEEKARMQKQREEIGSEFCRGCDYCQPCPNDVAISRVLRSERGLRRLGKDWLDDNLNEIEEEVSSCDECGTCLPRCPYDLDIPELLREKLSILKEYAE